MKAKIVSLIAAILLFGAAGTQAQPQEYSVQITADWQAIGAVGGVPADLTIQTETGVYTRTLNNLLAGPSFQVTLDAAPPYSWTLKGWQHLSTWGVSASTEISAGVQLVGDAAEYLVNDPRCAPVPSCFASGDDVVDALDFSRLKAWFGAERPCCAPAIFQQATTDFDGNGIVNTEDFVLLAQNFGQAGNR